MTDRTPFSEAPLPLTSSPPSSPTASGPSTPLLGQTESVESKTSTGLLTKLGMFSSGVYSLTNALLHTNKVIRAVKEYKDYIGTGWHQHVSIGATAFLSLPLLESNLRASLKALIGYQSNHKAEKDEKEKKFESAYPIKSTKVKQLSASLGGVLKTAGTISSAELFLQDDAESYRKVGGQVLLPIIAYANLVTTMATFMPKSKKQELGPLLSPNEKKATWSQKCFAGLKKTHQMLVNAVYSTANTFLYVPDTQKLLEDVMKSMRGWFSSVENPESDKIIEMTSWLLVSLLALGSYKANLRSSSSALHDLHGLPYTPAEASTIEILSSYCLAMIKTLGTTASLWGFLQQMTQDDEMHPFILGLFYLNMIVSLGGNFHTNLALSNRGLGKDADIRNDVQGPEFSEESDQPVDSTEVFHDISFRTSESGSSHNLTEGSLIPGNRSSNLIPSSSSIQGVPSDSDGVIHSGSRSVFYPGDDVEEDLEDPKSFTERSCIIG